MHYFEGRLYLQWVYSQLTRTDVGRFTLDNNNGIKAQVVKKSEDINFVPTTAGGEVAGQNTSSKMPGKREQVWLD